MTPADTTDTVEEGYNDTSSTDEIRNFRAKAYHFVIHNYTDTMTRNLKKIIAEKTCKAWVYGFEICPTTGTPHIQGYFRFSDARWRDALKKSIGYRGYMVKANGGDKANLIYCGKDLDYKSSHPVPKPLRLISELRPWQQGVMDIVTGPPDDRIIHWFWEETGNVGKSALCKLLCAKHDAIICAGKAADMKHQIAEYIKKKKRDPELIIFDVPRSNKDYLSYTGIEEIKNGLFASSKYDSCMVIMNNPHVLIFANFEPDRAKMSLDLSMDKWKVHNLKDIIDMSSILCLDRASSSSSSSSR